MVKKLVGVTLAALLTATIAASAQNYPNRPMTMVIPFAAGGPQDQIGRVMAQRMGELLGHQVVVENIGGAGGMTGSKRAADAQPDGYTFVLASVGTHAQGQTLYKRPLYNAATDFTPVALIAETPIALIARKDLPVKDLKEFVTYAKANQAKMQYGSAGAGSATHLGCVVLNYVLGVDITHVPYRGTAPALTELMGGNVQLMIDPTFALLPAAKDGVRARPLAIATKARSQLAPEVPTMAESGLPGFEFNSWYGIWAPKGTPREISEKVNALVQETMRDSAIAAKLTNQLLEPVIESIDESKKFIASEIVRASELLKLVNFQPS
jgi:tripartite-type tricarboxylate transporter receptor subunit TctC